LPHDALSLEINSRISRGDASDAAREVRLHFLSERLDRSDFEIHEEYISHVSAQIKRELRICRDVYGEFLDDLNNRSFTAKATVALDHAIAPLASRRLREEVLTYVDRAKMSIFMFAVLFYRLFSRLARHPAFNSDWVKTCNVIEALIPNTSFQELKNSTSRQISTIARGPFGDPAEPPQIVYVKGREVGLKPNTIWDFRNELIAYELWRMWDFVFREICDQHAAIDCAEKSNVALALITLTPFERLAGRMFYEVSENFLTHVPDEVFLNMGRELDSHKIGLLENLDPRGREILRYLGRQGKPITTWEGALTDTRERRFLPAGVKNRAEATTLKEFGTLSRSAKRAFYRAKDSYGTALEAVYEKRIPVSMRGHPFRLNS